jgi:hypothetical protein
MLGFGDYAKAALSFGGLYSAAHTAHWRLVESRHRLLSPWNLEYSALFIHIPKTAGTTIHELFGIEVRERGPHIPAYAYRWASPAFFDHAFKFAVVRNPWDRMVSAFHFLKEARWPDDKVWSDRHLKGVDTFADFLEALRRPFFRNLVRSELHFHPQVGFVADLKGRLLVDQVIYFENLAPGLRRVADRLQLQLPDVGVEQLNASERGDYRDYYDTRGRELVGRMYARDIETFGYQFEGAKRCPRIGYA